MYFICTPMHYSIHHHLQLDLGLGLWSSSFSKDTQISISLETLSNYLLEDTKTFPGLPRDGIFLVTSFPFLKRTVASETEVPILFPAASHSAPNSSSESWRSCLEGAKRTTSSANIQNKIIQLPGQIS